jgi:hypothetical protein
MSRKITGEPLTATEKLQKDVSETTDAAVRQGQRDVDKAKAIGGGYVEQTKGLAQSAIDTAKVMVSQRGERGMETNHECFIDLPPSTRHRRAKDRYR